VENGRASNLMKSSTKRKRTREELEEVKNEEAGRASNLMKSSTKRKRTREELEEVKNEEAELRDDKQTFL